MWLIGLGLAAAHPGAFRVAAHDLTAIVDDNQLTLHYTLEAPRLVELHDAPAHDVVPSIEEMLSGFVVRTETGSLALEPVGDATVRDSHSTAAVSVSFTAPLERGTQTLTLENANYPQLDGLFRTQWALGPDWRFVGGSQYEHAENGAWQRVQRSEWTGVDAGRESTLSVAPRPFWHAYTMPLPHEPRRVLDTTVPPLWLAWAQGVPHPAFALIAIVLAPMCATVAPRSNDWRKGPIVLAAALMAGILAWVGHPVVVLGVGIAALFGTAISRQWWLCGLGAGISLCAAASLWPWAVVAGALAGLATRRGEPQRTRGVAVGIGVGVTLLWGIRSVA